MMSRSIRRHGVTIVICGPSYDSLDEDAVEETGGLMLVESSHIEPPLLVLDMSRTRFIGSCFIELMLRTWKRLKQRGKNMVLCGVTPFCGEVLQITKLTTLWRIVWRIVPSKQDAIAALTWR
jgi:anti-anti-sigma factor